MVASERTGLRRTTRRIVRRYWWTLILPAIVVLVWISDRGSTAPDAMAGSDAAITVILLVCVETAGIATMHAILRRVRARRAPERPSQPGRPVNGTEVPELEPRPTQRARIGGARSEAKAVPSLSTVLGAPPQSLVKVAAPKPQRSIALTTSQRSPELPSPGIVVATTPAEPDWQLGLLQMMADRWPDDWAHKSVRVRSRGALTRVGRTRARTLVPRCIADELLLHQPTGEELIAIAEAPTNLAPHIVVAVRHRPTRLQRALGYAGLLAGAVGLSTAIGFAAASADPGASWAVLIALILGAPLTIGLVLALSGEPSQRCAGGVIALVIGAYATLLTIAFIHDVATYNYSWTEVLVVTAITLPPAVFGALCGIVTLNLDKEKAIQRRYSTGAPLAVDEHW